MKRSFTIAVLAMLVLHINNATATPVPGVEYHTSGSGCYITEYSSSLLTSAVNYSQIVQTNCASFKTYQVRPMSSSSWFYIAECATCKSGYYENGYAVSTTDGMKNGTATAVGPDWKIYTYSACGDIAFQASCSAKTTCSIQQITMETTTIPYCNAEKTIVVGNSAWRSCTECSGGNIAKKGNTKTPSSPSPCTNQYQISPTANTCLEPCSDSNCGNKTTDWTCGEYANGTASDAACWRTKYYCYDSVHCSTTQENKCVSGYYMSDSTCATCPAGSDGNAAQSPDAATSINDCYVTSGRDPSGIYSYVDGASPYMCNYGE